MLVRSHDALFRFVFGETAHAAELLRATLPRSVAAAIDWPGLVRVDGSFVDPARVQQGVKQGRREGLHQGRLTGLRTLLEEQLRARIGELPEPVVARVAAADEGMLRRWGRSLLEAATLDGVFAPRA